MGQGRGAAPETPLEKHLEKTERAGSRGLGLARRFSAEPGSAAAGARSSSSSAVAAERDDSVKELEIVDLEKDKRVFAIIDDGCNRTCHSSSWYKHAQKVFSSMKLSPTTIDLPVKDIYKGIGQKEVKARRKFSISILLDDGRAMDGTLESNEMRDSGHYMLLSLPVQRTLGIIKYQRTRQCYIENAQAYVPLYKVKGSGLHCICISDGFLADGEGLPPSRPATPEVSDAELGDLTSFKDYVPVFMTISNEQFCRRSYEKRAQDIDDILALMGKYRESNSADINEKWRQRINKLLAAHNSRSYESVKARREAPGPEAKEKKPEPPPVIALSVPA